MNNSTNAAKDVKRNTNTNYPYLEINYADEGSYEDYIIAGSEEGTLGEREVGFNDFNKQIPEPRVSQTIEKTGQCNNENNCKCKCLNSFEVEIKGEKVDISKKEFNSFEILKKEIRDSSELSISDLGEFRRFINFMNNEESAAFHGGIKHIDLNAIEIDGESKELIDQLLSLDLPELLYLSLGKIKLKEIVFVGKFEKLRTLSVEAIGGLSTVRFLKNLARLSTFKIGCIEAGMHLTVIGKIDELQTLVIEDIKKRSSLHLHDFEVNNLENLTIGTCFEDIEIILPRKLDELRKVYLNDFHRNVALYLPKRLPKLQEYKIGNILPNTSFQVNSSLSNIKRLVFGNICDFSHVEFISQMRKLENLEMGDILENTIISFPEELEFNELINFKIGNVLSTQFRLPDMSGLEHLSIGNIYHGVKIDFLWTFNWLETIKIGDIYPGGTLDLSTKVFPALKKLQLGRIHEGAILELPLLINKEFQFEIEEIRDQKLLEKLHEHFPRAIITILRKKKEKKVIEKTGEKKKENCSIQ